MTDRVPVCAITRLITQEPPTDVVEGVFPIAGELREKGGKDLDAKWERMKHGTSNSDAEKEGLRVVMKWWLQEGE